jgi:putative Mg2+ transporter-C (MgtC) family protein
MDPFLNELRLGLPDGAQVARIVVRLVAASLLGAVIGIQRERAGKPAGLRTHMLVALGAAMFILAGLESGMPLADVSRIIQGLAAGIGFLGAGAILKLTDAREITGLTTAAGIWMTAAIGVTAGLGHWGAAAISVLLSVIILEAVGAVEFRFEERKRKE